MQPLLDELGRRHGIRPQEGLQILSWPRLVTQPFDPGMALLIVPDGDAAGVDGAPIPGRHGHGADPVALLRRLYPPEHRLLGVEDAPDVELADVDAATLVARTWLVPPVPGVEALASPHGLPWLVARLRAPDGCPWDREQDHLTLRPYLLEETYEVYDALDAGSTPALAEELGDLLLQIVLHAQYGAEAGIFDLTDVYREVMAKIIRRHPHVFGDVEARTATDVIRNWERIKADERGERSDADAGAPTPTSDPHMPAAFAGLSRSLPALAYASEMQGRAAGLGYDWPDMEGVIDKIAEEAVELLGATDEAARREEFGDLLFVVVNLGRKLGVDAEAALRAASRKFASRFARVERMAGSDGVQLRALGLDELDELWQRAKSDERAELPDPGDREPLVREPR